MSRARALPAMPPFVLLLLLLLAGCAAPRFDGRTDALIAETQGMVSDRMGSLIALARQADRLRGNDTPAARTERAAIQRQRSYADNIPFYTNVETRLGQIEARFQARATRSTPAILQTTAALRQLLLAPAPESMEAVHEAQDQLSAAFLLTRRRQVNTGFDAIAAYELSFKDPNTQP